MKLITGSLLVVHALVTASAAFAQLPGEVKSPGSYNPVGEMQHNSQLWAPSEKVREIQSALRDRGFYRGELDGVLNPQFRRAIWDFQRAKGLPTTARLDAPTIAALEVPATGAASPAPRAPSSFGGSARPAPSPVEAP
jgi:peptidoglycan hydrolase-like protein with peptidoglycan-binding domain